VRGMATIAVGDIHGNLRALDDLLCKVLAELKPEDVLVFLGDYIDRGSDSRGCLERIVRLREDADFQVLALQGNHEYWMLRSFRDHTRHYWLLGLEAFQTIASYSVEAVHYAAKSNVPGRLCSQRKRLFRMGFSSTCCP